MATTTHEKALARPKAQSKGPPPGLLARLFRAKARSGSGLPARKVIQILVWVRRAVQIGSFWLFSWFLFQTAFRGTFASATPAFASPSPSKASSSPIPSWRR